MNSVENKSVKIPKNMKNRMLIRHVNNINRRIPFVTISSLDGIVEQLRIT